MKNTVLFVVACSLVGSMFLTRGTISFGEEQVQVPTVYGNFVDETRAWATLGRLYVILATDDQEPELGDIAQKNGEIFEKVLKNNLAKGSTAILKIPAGNLSREMVFQMISNLPLRENDALLFYFSGKGGIDRKTGQFFQFSASGEDLFRSELQDAMNKHKHRLNVLISDFCDKSSVSATEITNKSEVQEVVATDEQPETTSPLFFSLFFYTGGNIDLTSSFPGQASHLSGSGIGCFTETLTGMMQANRCKQLSWSFLFPYLRDGTSLLFKQKYPEGTTTADGIRQIDQVPVASALGRNKIISPMFDKIYPQGFAATENMPESSKPLTEDDRNVITSLVRKVVEEVRPYNDRDDNSHVNSRIIDTDNVVLGTNGKPFSHQVEPIVITEATPNTKPEETKPEEKIRLGVQATDNNGNGVRITRILPGYPAEKEGLEVGDVILEINGKKIVSEQDYSEAVDTATTKLEMLIRDKTTGRSVPLTIGLQ